MHHYQVGFVSFLLAIISLSSLLTEILVPLQLLQCRPAPSLGQRRRPRLLGILLHRHQRHRPNLLQYTTIPLLSLQLSKLQVLASALVLSLLVLPTTSQLLAQALLRLLVSLLLSSKRVDFARQWIP